MQRLNLKESSNIEEAWYSCATLKLVVTFKKGQQYEYSMVPNGVMASWEQATSAGKFFCANIQKAFSYKRISALEEAI